MIRTLVLFFIFLSACTIDREKNVDREKFSFSTGDDTELFFKNMRSSYYLREERTATRWEIYRHEDLYADSSAYALNIAIVINILKDEAYILLEPGKELAARDEIIVFWATPDKNENGEISLKTKNIVAMREFAALLFEAIRKNKDLHLQVDGQMIPVLDDPASREAFRITMADYFRLIRVF